MMPDSTSSPAFCQSAKNASPLITVLVSVYNGASSLQKTLDSLYSQTYDNLEILCINDGSTDSSLQIMQEYGQKDSRVRIIDLHTNHGLAKALNEGIRQCTGDLIAFLDSDDWLAPDSLEKIKDCFISSPEADCALFDVVYVNEAGAETHHYPGYPFPETDGYDAFVKSLTWKMHGWYVARASLYRQYPYDDTCRTYSNDNTTRIHFYHSRKVVSSDALYYYRFNSESITHVVSLSRLDYMHATQSMKRQLLAMDCSKEVLRIYEGEKWRVVVDTYKYYFLYRRQFKKAERKLFLDEIKRGWLELDTQLIAPSELRKRGMRPFKGHWYLFRFQQEAIFLLRKITGRLN